MNPYKTDNHKSSKRIGTSQTGYKIDNKNFKSTQSHYKLEKCKLKQ